MMAVGIRNCWYRFTVLGEMTCTESSLAICDTRLSVRARAEGYPVEIAVQAIERNDGDAGGPPLPGKVTGGPVELPVDQGAHGATTDPQQE